MQENKGTTMQPVTSSTAVSSQTNEDDLERLLEECLADFTTESEYCRPPQDVQKDPDAILKAALEELSSRSGTDSDTSHLGKLEEADLRRHLPDEKVDQIIVKFAKDSKEIVPEPSINTQMEIICAVADELAEDEQIVQLARKAFLERPELVEQLESLIESDQTVPPTHLDIQQIQEQMQFANEDQMSQVMGTINDLMMKRLVTPEMQESLEKLLEKTIKEILSEEELADLLIALAAEEVGVGD